MITRQKVLHIITGLGNGGAEGVLTRLCLNTTGIEHVVISLSDEGKYGSVLKKGGVNVRSLDMSPSRPSPVKMIQLIKWIKDERPDVVQTWMYHGDLLGGITAKFAGVDRIFWGIRHSTLDKNNSKRLTRIVAKLCAALSYVIPRKIICCAEKAREVHGAIGYAKKKLVVIPNGYDLNRFKPDAEAGRKVRAELGIPLATPLIGMVGRFAAQKDHKTLITALEICKSEIPNFFCLLVGANIDDQNIDLVKLIKTAGLGGQVRLGGQRSDIPEVMNALDIHVLSSNGGEGFPNVIAEAMACGTPCVSTNVGDSKIIMADTGKVCPPNNPTLLAKSIVSLLSEKFDRSDAWLCRKKSCRDEVKEKYSIDKTVNAFLSVWKD
jgi:glycosyltransferase involved in cell wall biosynthesis